MKKQVNALAAAPTLTRITAGTLPMITDATHQTRDAVGPLLQLDTAGLADQELRSAERLNRELQEAWETNNVLAWRSVVARCLALQTNKGDFTAASTVTGIAALRHLEDGSGRQREYAQAVPEWRRMAEATGDAAVVRVMDESLAAIAEALVPEKERGSTNGLLRGIALRYGKDVYKAQTGMAYSTFDVRARSGLLGHFDVNMNAVVAMVRYTAPRPAETDAPAEEPTLASQWEHPWMLGLRTAWMKDVEAMLRKEKACTPVALLCERLKMLAAHAGIKQNEAALRTTFQIPARTARPLAANKAIEETHVLTILTKLVADKHIPQQAADDFLGDWRVAIEADNTVTPQERWRTTLDANKMTNADIALALDVRGHDENVGSPSTLVAEVVRDLRVNTAVPPYVLACLVNTNEPGIDADTSEVLRELMKRDRSGKTWIVPYRLMTQFGIRTQDLPDPWDKRELTRYASDEHGGAAERELSGPVFRMGWARATAALHRWSDLQEPSTVRTAAGLLRQKVGSVPLTKNVPISNDYGLDQIQNGEAVPALEHLRTLVRDGGATMTDALLTDWYFSRARVAAASGATLLARGMDVTAASESTSMHQFLHSRGTPGKDSIRKITTAIGKGEVITPEQLGKTLAYLGIDATQPRGLFLTLAQTHTDSAALLQAWCEALVREGHTDIALQVVRARSELVLRREEQASLEERPMDKLRTAISRKNGVAARLRGETPPQLPDMVAPVLPFCPGITDDDLCAWQPKFDTPPVPKSQPEAVRVPNPAPAVAAKKKVVAAAPVVRETVVNPDEALYEQVTGALYERVPAEYRQFWDALAKQCNLRGMFDFQTKKRNNRDAGALETLMWSALSIAITRTERR